MKTYELMIQYWCSEEQKNAIKHEYFDGLSRQEAKCKAFWAYGKSITILSLTEVML